MASQGHIELSQKTRIFLDNDNGNHGYRVEFDRLQKNARDQYLHIQKLFVDNW